MKPTSSDNFELSLDLVAATLPQPALGAGFRPAKASLKVLWRSLIELKPAALPAAAPRRCAPAHALTGSLVPRSSLIAWPGSLVPRSSLIAWPAPPGAPAHALMGGLAIRDDRGTSPTAAHPAAPARRGCARAAGRGQPDAPLRTENASPFPTGKARHLVLTSLL